MIRTKLKISQNSVDGLVYFVATIFDRATEDETENRIRVTLFIGGYCKCKKKTVEVPDITGEATLWLVFSKH